MGEGWRHGPLKFSELVMLLGLCHRLLALSLLHISHRLLHSLQHLFLHHQDLLKGLWWRPVVGSIFVLICVVVAVVSVHHLVIMEISETKKEIKIKHSQLYASRYNDD
jgi:hypothetical protein